MYYLNTLERLFIWPCSIPSMSMTWAARRGSWPGFAVGPRSAKMENPFATPLVIGLVHDASLEEKHLVRRKHSSDEEIVNKGQFMGYLTKFNQHLCFFNHQLAGGVIYVWLFHHTKTRMMVEMRSIFGVWAKHGQTTQQQGWRESFRGSGFSFREKSYGELTSSCVGQGGII